MALLAAVGPLRGGEPTPVVADRGDQPTTLGTHGHPDAMALGMLDHVAQCFLHHPVDEPLVPLIQGLLRALEHPGDLLPVEPGQELAQGGGEALLVEEGRRQLDHQRPQLLDGLPRQVAGVVEEGFDALS